MDVLRDVLTVPRWAAAGIVALALSGIWLVLLEPLGVMSAWAYALAILASAAVVYWVMSKADAPRRG
jgi:hypothetical protein